MEVLSLARPVPRGKSGRNIYIINITFHSKWKSESGRRRKKNEKLIWTIYRVVSWWIYNNCIYFCYIIMILIRFRVLFQALPLKTDIRIKIQCFLCYIKSLKTSKMKEICWILVFFFVCSFGRYPREANV